MAKKCEICEATLAGDGSGHYARHLRIARKLIEGFMRPDLNADQIKAAQERIAICERELRKYPV